MVYPPLMAHWPRAHEGVVEGTTCYIRDSDMLRHYPCDVYWIMIIICFCQAYERYLGS